MRVILIIPSLLLQKPSKEGKLKDHLKALLKRQMELWKSGNLLYLFEDSLTIQRILKSVYKAKYLDQIFRKYIEDMQKGNLNGTLKLLTDNMQHEIRPLNEETILKLKIKLPQSMNPGPEVLLPHSVSNVHPVGFESIVC